MRCPRRDEAPFDLREDKGLDEFVGNVCSYCGSLSPDLLMSRLEAGTVRLMPTDKRYKVYVESLDGTELPSTKFYFQHFDESQKRRFIGLLNEKKIPLTFPGHFYVLPFFIQMGH